MSTTPQRLGKYELQTHLGGGGTGEVWQSYDWQAQCSVAIKLLHPDLLQSDPHFMTSFMHNWQTIIALHHPNIVQVYEVNISRPSASNGIDTTTPYIVMDYIEGHTTLAEYIQRTSRANKFPPVTDIISLFTQLASAIDYAHTQGIVHGNIKPTNILLNTANTQQLSSGEPMLIDFGIASLPSNKSSLSPFYLAPEQVKGQPARPSSDIYGLGMILYEICTGVLPFHGQSFVAIMMHHIHTLPTPPMLINPHIPAALSEVILRAIAKDPSTRFATASLLADALAEACSIKQTPLLTLNKTQAESTEPLSYPTSGPLPLFSTGPQPPLPIASILGVAQPYSDTPGQYPTVASQDNSPLISSQPITAPHVPTRAPQHLPTPASQLSGKISTPSSIQIVTPPPAGSKQASKSRRNHFSSPLPMTIAFLFLLLIIVVALATSTFLHLASQSTSTSSAVVGHVFFQDDALGHDDLLRLELHAVPPPPQGQRYYAWYQNAAGQTFPLGPLTLNQGTFGLLYPGDAQHTNLLSIVQTVFVTLEKASTIIPATPPSHAKVYQASFAMASLPYIQHVLYMQPNFPSHSSLITGLLETIKGMNDKAGSIVDSLQGTHDYALARRQAIRIIEMIDGSSYALSSGDLPTNLPSLASVPVGLLSSPSQPGYLATLQTEIAKIQQTAGENSTLRQHAQNVSTALTDLQDWIQQMRTYDLQLLQAPDLSTSAMLSSALQLQQFAQDAYTGRTIPPNQSPQPIPGSAGAYQAFTEAQYMATLDVKKVS